MNAKLFENLNSTSFTIKYYPNQFDATNNQNEILNSFYNTTVNLQTIAIKIYFTGTCFTILDVFLKVKSLPMSNNQSLIQCKSLAGLANSATFNLFDANALFQNNNSNYLVNYYLNSNDLQNNVSLPNSFTSTSNPQIILIKIVDKISKCYKNYTLTLQVNLNSPRIIEPLEICESEIIINGITNFDLTAANLNLLFNEDFAFYPTEEYAISEQNEITDTDSYQNTTPFNSSVYVRINDGINCRSVSELKLIVNKKTKIDTEFSDDLYLCKNNSNRNVILKAGTLEGLITDYQYKWLRETIDLNIITSQIQITETGNYSVEITNFKNCKITKKFLVKESEIASIVTILTNDFNGTANTVLVNVTGNGSYEFSLDGTNFQDSNLFENIPAGVYEIIINDKKGCGETPKKIQVLSYPTFFTPNNDGFNDTWIIENIDTKQNNVIKIFDRFGKFLANINTAIGWNGKFNGDNLPADDYWFILLLETGREIKGHFSLKR